LAFTSLTTAKTAMDGVFAIKQDAEPRKVTNLGFVTWSPSLQGPWMALQA